MTTQELSNQFDILYNNASNSAPGLDEYEKSVILTKAEKDLVRDYFNSRTVKTGEGFDDSQKRQYDFSTLLRTVKLELKSPLLIGFKGYQKDFNIFDNRSLIYVAPHDFFLSINESIIDNNNRRYSVLPISYSEYNRLMLKPYGYPLKRQAWRIISDSSPTLGEYSCTYVEFQSGTSKFLTVIRSKSSKDLFFHIRRDSLSTDNTLKDPIITVKDKFIDIQLLIPKGRMVNYWNMYLQNEDALKKGKLDGYIYPLDGNINGTWTTDDIKPVDIYIPSCKTQTGESVSAPVFEIIGNFPSFEIEYNMRYVRTPKPIILVDLSEVQEGLSIDGYNKITECELPANMHEEILQRAVELAKATYQGDLNSIIQTGNISGTELGYQIKQN